MDPRVTHLNPAGLHNNPAFTQAVVVEGHARTVYIGGQNAVAADGQVTGGGDLESQTEQVFKNLEMQEPRDDSIRGRRDVARHRQVDDLRGLGAGYRASVRRLPEDVGPEPQPPAISVIVVAGLANPAFLVEVEAVAVTGSEAPDAG